MDVVGTIAETLNVIVAVPDARANDELAAVAAKVSDAAPMPVPSD